MHDASNKIHPTAIIGDSVQLGRNNVVMPYAVVLGPCSVGDGNWIGPHVAIGTPSQFRIGEHPDATQEQGLGVTIGSGNRIREFVTIHQGSERLTVVGNDCYLMAYAHVPHDAILEDGVTMANSAQVGGYTWIGEGATIGLGASIRQRSRIGPYSMVGMNATITRDIPPFAVAIGSPARVTGVNAVGVERAGVSDTAFQEQLDRDLAEGREPTPESLPDPLRQLMERYGAAVTKLS